MQAGDAATPIEPGAAVPDPSVPAAQTAVLLFGEVLIDCFPDREVLGGAPYNVARHLRGLGLDPVLVTRIGNDAAGDDLWRAMARHGLSRQGVQRDPVHATGRVNVHLDADGHRFDIVPGQAYDFIHAQVARLVALATRPAVIYFGTLAQRAGSHQALREVLRAGPAHTFLDVNLREPWVREDILRWSLGQANTVKVNADELDRMSVMLGLGGDSLPTRGAALVAAYDLDALLVTRGEQGACWLDADGRMETIDGAPVDGFIDSVGAGDAFAAMCLLGRLFDWPTLDILRRAHAFAGTICRQRGAVPDDDAFYQPFRPDLDGMSGTRPANAIEPARERSTTDSPPR